MVCFNMVIASHTGNLRISPETMSSSKLLSLSENIFVQPLRNVLLGAWLLRVVVGEVLLAQTMTRLQTLLFLDWSHTKLERTGV